MSLPGILYRPPLSRFSEANAHARQDPSYFGPPPSTIAEHLRFAVEHVLPPSLAKLWAAPVPMDLDARLTLKGISIKGPFQGISLFDRIDQDKKDPITPNAQIKAVNTLKTIFARKPNHIDEITEGHYILIEQNDINRFTITRVSKPPKKEIDRYMDNTVVYHIGSKERDFLGDFELRSAHQNTDPFDQDETILTKSRENAWQEIRYICYYPNGFHAKRIENKIWILSREEAEIFSPLRKRMIDYPSEYKMTRKELTIFAALTSMQYVRYSRDHNLTDKSYVSINYGLSLDILIKRFGLEIFSKTVKKIFNTHLRYLHGCEADHPDDLQPHSDIVLPGESLPHLGYEAILGQYDFPRSLGARNMNANSLFGDPSFWYHLRTFYPNLFHELVDYLAGLPKQFELARYSKYVADPVGVIQNLFPKAHAEIIQLRPDFKTDAAAIKLASLQP